MTTEMKVTISQGDVVINMPKDKTRIGMRISGGADSSMLAYMMAVYKRDAVGSVKNAFGDLGDWCENFNIR